MGIQVGSKRDVKQEFGARRARIRINVGKMYNKNG